MKKLIFVAGFIVAVVAFASPVYAQVKTRVGPMLSFAGGDVDQTGLGVVGEFGVSQKVTIAPQLIFYLPENDVHFFEANINVNYYFFNQDVFEIYGLGGLNIAHGKVELPGDDVTDTEVGLNLGIGSNFDFGKTFVPFAELRFTVGDFDQVALGLGVKFNVK